MQNGWRQRTKNFNNQQCFCRTKTSQSTATLLSAVRRNATALCQDSQLIQSIGQTCVHASNGHSHQSVQSKSTQFNDTGVWHTDTGVAHLTIHSDRPDRKGSIGNQAQSGYQRTVRWQSAPVEMVRGETESMDSVCTNK